jgi:hypothetical protein
MTDYVPTDGANFYIPSSNETEQVRTNSDANLSTFQSSADIGASEGVGLPFSATAPQLDSLEIMDIPVAGSFRSRAHSAPSILYQQVALQLRNISDDFNAEYTQAQVIIIDFYAVCWYLYRKCPSMSY